MWKALNENGFPGRPAGIGVVDEVKPENLKAMVDFTRQYGKYL